jgi:DNA-binding CsgD family transcriptional regulator
VWLADPRYGELIDRAARVARERGELGILADTLGLRALRLANEQRFEQAGVAASEAVELVRALGARNLELLIDTALAVIAAFQGRDEEARLRAEQALRLATARGLRFRASTAVYALALADMSAGAWVDALQRFDSLLKAELGHLDPVALRTLPDKIEAAVRAGRLAEARSALPLYEALAAYSADRSFGPRLAACRALLADGDEATEHFEAALRLGEDAHPLDLARIQLLYGEHLRRGRRRTDARIHLRASVEGFERLGAEPWAERARSELRASGETARKRDPSTLSQLTPQELQVAHLVADGLSNKEVAAQLFLSPRTIDAHLRSVFAKLGITSRTQLARLPLHTGSAGSEPVSAVASG